MCLGGGERTRLRPRRPQAALYRREQPGSLAQCRIYSKYLGLQIKALETGLLN